MLILGVCIRYPMEDLVVTRVVFDCEDSGGRRCCESSKATSFEAPSAPRSRAENVEGKRHGKGVFPAE